MFCWQNLLAQKCLLLTLSLFVLCGLSPLSAYINFHAHIDRRARTDTRLNHLNQSLVSAPTAPIGEQDEIPTERKLHNHGGVKVATLKFDYVKAELILAMFILLIGLFKLIYHQFKYPQEVVPESCCLILLGTFLGMFFLWSGRSRDVSFLEFDSKAFFFFLLPPIILEAAYSLKDRAFVDNLGTILLYAVLGTVLNVALIGGGLVLFNWGGMFGGFRIGVLDSLLFASLIAAVDPVAVLAIFQELGVNKMLYFMVFGESLLNDAVTVVCYNLVNEFKELNEITFFDCILGVLAFLCVSFGGLSIGFFLGVLSSLITRFTINARVVEPVVCFTMAYLSYLCAELFHFSGIIGIISCGITQNHFMMSNLSAKSQVSVHYIIKVVSSISESLIFIILGVMLVNEQSGFWEDEWNIRFAIYSLAFCIISRFIVVFILTYIVNQFTGGFRYISFQEQVIMAYGGLRGAVSFSLAFMLPDDLSTKKSILFATYIVILFTVFGQGCTIKFLVRCLNIGLAMKEDNFRLFNAFTKGVVQHMTQGIEDIMGVKDYTWARRVSDWTRLYIRPFLQRDYVAQQTYDRLVMIESEENFKETLRSCASQPTLANQRTTVVEDFSEEFSERGSVTFDLVDELYDQKQMSIRRRRRPTTREERDREVKRLTGDTMNIQALIQGLNKASYPDRNLVNEEMKEQRRRSSVSLIASAILNEQYDQNIDRVFDIRDLTDLIQHRNIFGMTKVKKKFSVSKGILAVAAPALGVTGSAYRGGAQLNRTLSKKRPSIIPVFHLSFIKRRPGDLRHPSLQRQQKGSIRRCSLMTSRLDRFRGSPNFTSLDELEPMRNRPPRRPSAPKPPSSDESRVKFHLERQMGLDREVITEEPETIRLIDDEEF